jgi:hypothetical protein
MARRCRRIQSGRRSTAAHSQSPIPRALANAGDRKSEDFKSENFRPHRKDRIGKTARGKRAIVGAMSGYRRQRNGRRSSRIVLAVAAALVMVAVDAIRELLGLPNRHWIIGAEAGVSALLAYQVARLVSRLHSN